MSIIHAQTKTDRMKVLLVIRWPVGGIRTFVRYVYRNFDPEIWQFTILAPDLSELHVLLDDLSALSVRYVRVAPEPNVTQFALSIATELTRGHYDLVHSHGFTSGLCTVVPATLRRTGHLMTSHDVINPNQFVGVKGKIKQQVIGSMFGMITTIHSVSQDAQRNFLDFFPALSRSAGRCIVIPNGIEVERFRHVTPRDLRRELRLGADVFLVGFLGRFMSQKGFRYLIEAIDLLRNDNDLPQKPLVLAFGDGGFIREDKQIVKDKGLLDHFHFLPFAPDVAGSIMGLDVIVMPSLWEACGLLAMETLACGTPLIGTDCIGLREVLRDTPAITVPTADASALAQAIKQEMISSSKAAFMSFRETAVAKYDVGKQYAGIEALYRSIIGTFNGAWLV